MAVCQAHAMNETPVTLSAISDKTQVRRRTVSCSKHRGKWYDKSIEHHADVRASGWVGHRARELTFTLKTLQSPLKIVSLVCFVYNPGEYNFTVTMQAVGSSESIVAESRFDTGGYESLFIAVSTCEREAVLLPNTKYNVTVSCDREYYVYPQRGRTDRREHFVLEFLLAPSGEFFFDSSYGSPVAYIHYKTLTPR